MFDNSHRYGSVTRFLHWAMALILLWQMFTVAVRITLEDSALDTFAWGTHRAFGVILLLLAAIRLGWAIVNWTRRPPAISLAARLGHITLYGLLIVVPALGLLRHFGAGRSLDVFGLPLLPGFDGKIEPLVWLGNQLHGSLGWLLIVLMLGHTAMVVWHRKGSGQVDVLPRMWR